PGPCIDYIRSPTVHRTWKYNYVSKYKLLNTFSHQQLEQSFDFYQCPSRVLVKACRTSFLSAVGGCRTPDLCLGSDDWPCADHMHSSPKKNSLAIHTKLSMFSLPPRLCSFSRWTGDYGRRGGSEKTGSNILYTQCRGLPP
ncbi:unnamed protein product, partial [Staurois parvus]